MQLSLRGADELRATLRRLMEPRHRIAPSRIDARTVPQIVETRGRAREIVIRDIHPGPALVERAVAALMKQPLSP